MAYLLKNKIQEPSIWRLFFVVATEPFLCGKINHKQRRNGNAMAETNEIAVQLVRIEQRLTDTDRRIVSLENTIKRIESLTLSVEKLALSVENMARDQVEYRADQNALAKRLLEVEKQPLRDKAEKHDRLVTKVIEIVLAGVVGFLISSVLG